ncbi:MAG: Neuraminidase (sialidase) [Lentimonas sp.]|jgi:Neuraminidase (sialidase)
MTKKIINRSKKIQLIFSGIVCFSFLVTSCSVSTPIHSILQKPEKSRYQYSQVEPSIAINPNNTDQIIAGTILNDFYYSEDGGSTWTSKSLQSTYGVYGDPVLIYDYKGRAYYFHLASYKKTTHLDRIVCQYTDDLSQDFTDGSFPKPASPKVQDKHWVVVNEENGELYMTWTQFDRYNSAAPKDSSIIVFSKSKDRGETWSDPLRISKDAGDCLDDDNTVEGAVPILGRNGQLFVTWTGPNGLVYQKSNDLGLTWMNTEKPISQQIEGWTLEIPGMNRANGLPVLKSDLSGGNFNGNLYLNWADQRNGIDNTDIFLSISKDDGENWSEPVKVNQDQGKAHQFFTWMTVDQSSGHLYFVYYDRRDLKDNQTQVYLACSKDGGKTFIEKKIEKTEFEPIEKVFFGDYLNIDAVNGKICAIYPLFIDGEIKLQVTTVTKKFFK